MYIQSFSPEVWALFAITLLSALFPSLVYRFLRRRGVRSFATGSFTPWIAASAWMSLWLSQLLLFLIVTLLVVFFPGRDLQSIVLWSGLALVSLGLWRLSQVLLRVAVQLLLNGRERGLIERVGRGARLLGSLLGVPALLSAFYWWTRDCRDVGCIMIGIFLAFSLAAFGLAALSWLYGQLLGRALPEELPR